MHRRPTVGAMRAIDRVLPAHDTRLCRGTVVSAPLTSAYGVCSRWTSSAPPQAIGSFWALAIEWREVQAAEFMGSCTPGYGKLAIALRVDPADHGRTILHCELRTSRPTPSPASASSAAGGSPVSAPGWWQAGCSARSGGRPSITVRKRPRAGAGLARRPPADEGSCQRVDAGPKLWQAPAARRSTRAMPCRPRPARPRVECQQRPST